MAWEENSCICLNMQLIAILSRIGVGYDLMIRYKGQSYYFMVDEDCVWLSDENFTATIKKFANGNDVLENFCIENVPLYKLVDKLDDYEPM